MSHITDSGGYRFLCRLLSVNELWWERAKELGVCTVPVAWCKERRQISRCQIFFQSGLMGSAGYYDLPLPTLRCFRVSIRRTRLGWWDGIDICSRSLVTRMALVLPYAECYERHDHAVLC